MRKTQGWFAKTALQMTGKRAHMAAKTWRHEMLTSDAQFFLNRANEMRMAARAGHDSRRPNARSTDVNAFLDMMGLSGRVRRV